MWVHYALHIMHTFPQGFSLSLSHTRTQNTCERAYSSIAGRGIQSISMERNECARVCASCRNTLVAKFMASKHALFTFCMVIHWVWTTWGNGTQCNCINYSKKKSKRGRYCKNCGNLEPNNKSTAQENVLTNFYPLDCLNLNTMWRW